MNRRTGDQQTAECPSCGLRSPTIEGPTHRFMLSSPGCWATFGEVLALEFGDPAYFSLHQMTVDSYAASHPGRPERQAIQAIGLHLMTLQLFIEDGIDASEGPKLHKRMVGHPPELAWLEPPELHGRMTVACVLEATTASEHLVRIRSWAEEVWAAWAPHHPIVRDWVRQSLP